MTQMKTVSRLIFLTALGCGAAISASASSINGMVVFNNSSNNLYLSAIDGTGAPIKVVTIAPHALANAPLIDGKAAEFKIETTASGKVWQSDTLCSGNTAFPITQGSFMVKTNSTVDVTVSAVAGNYDCSVGATNIAEAYAFSQDIAQYNDRYTDPANPRKVKTILFDAGYLDYLGAPYWHTLTSGPYQNKPNLVNTSFQIVQGGKLVNTPLALELENLSSTGATIDLTYEMSNTVKSAVPSYSAKQMDYLVHQVVDPVVAFNQAHGDIISGISFDLESGDNSPGQSQFYRLLSAYAASKGLSISDFGFASAFTFTQDVALGPLGVVLPSMYDVGVARDTVNNTQFQDSQAKNDTSALQTYVTRSYKPEAEQDVNCESYKKQDENHQHPDPANYCNINYADTVTGINSYFQPVGESFNPGFKLSFLNSIKQSGVWFKPVMPFSATAQNWSYLDVYANAAEKSGTTTGDNYLSTFQHSGVMLHCVPGTAGCSANLSMQQLLQQTSNPAAGAFYVNPVATTACLRSGVPSADCTRVPGNIASLSTIYNEIPSAIQKDWQMMFNVVYKGTAFSWTKLSDFMPADQLKAEQLVYLWGIYSWLYQNDYITIPNNLGFALYKLGLNADTKCTSDYHSKICIASQPGYIGFKYIPLGQTTRENVAFYHEKQALWDSLRYLTTSYDFH